MIVARTNLEETLATLAPAPTLALDTETTGLRPYHGDALFSLVLHDGEKAYYFNFKTYDGIDPAHVLDRVKFGARFAAFFGGNSLRRWFLHNAKFDLAVLRREGWAVAGTIHDTMAVARVLDSTLFPNQFSLDECAKKIGYRKDDTVKSWLTETAGFTRETAPGKKTAKKNFHFEQVPFDIIVPYAERDAEITFKLGCHQLGALEKLNDEMLAAQVPATVFAVYENELMLTRTVFDMEERGVLIDRDFCARAIKDASATLLNAESKFAQSTGEAFKDSTLTYQRVFESDKERWVFGKETATGKRNPSFDSDVLQTFQSPAAQCVLAWRKAKSDANYYHGFLHEADADGVIHASFNQHAAATGRFSSSNPNLQNLTKDEDEDLKREFIVRRAIVPRPGFFFAMFDMDQAEYRLMLDYAARFATDDEGVKALIAKVLSGLDVHQATADLAGITRREAKTVNFATLYGSGIANLAGRLGVSQSRAREIRDSIFKAAPEIRTFIRRVTDAAEKRGWVANWFGRKCSFPDTRFSYRAPNYIIQGGVADIVKVGMNRVAMLLKDKRSKMVLNVHDEIILECVEDEAYLLPEVKRTLEGVYPHRFLPLTWGVAHSFKSLADKEEGLVCTQDPLAMGSDRT